MQVSVICTVLNEGESIRRLMDSLVAQTRTPDEVVIVDGGSSDNTVAILDEYRDRLRLRVLIERGANISRGRNVAIAAARGEIIASTDAGVRLEPQWLAELVKPLENSDARAAAGFFVSDPQTTFEVAMGATVLPDVEDIDPSKIDLLVIPGGHPSEIVKDPSLGNKVQAFLGKVREIDRRGGKLAAICGGPQWLALAGVLKGRRCTHSLERPGPEFEGAAFTGEYLTVDRNIITAQGQAYAEFAVEMGRQTGVYSREEDAQSDLDWLRDRKRDRC